MNAAQQVMMEMIEGDLQQAWACLQDEHHDLAIHHLKEAVEKAETMKATAPRPAQQVTLELES